VHRSGHSRLVAGFRKYAGSEECYAHFGRCPRLKRKFRHPRNRLSSGARSAPAPSTTHWSAATAPQSSAGSAERRLNPRTNSPSDNELARPSQPAPEPMVVSPRWLLSAFALTVLIAAVCGYATLCLLFYQGQWQLLFHPVRSIAARPAVRFDDLRFDVDENGHPRLDGWYIPADSGSQYVTDTVLYLHDARGSLSDCVPVLTTLHSLGINVFAFDYRGFGVSDGAHPNERLATEDSIAAWTRLTDTRHIPPSHLVGCGSGVRGPHCGAVRSGWCHSRRPQPRGAANLWDRRARSNFATVAVTESETRPRCRPGRGARPSPFPRSSWQAYRWPHGVGVHADAVAV
jgi:hypothetical protein